MRAVKNIDKIVQYVNHCKGLNYSVEGGDRLRIEQKIDGKFISIDDHRIDEVLSRTDTDGKAFIQVNFSSGSKILLTEQLIGFKPIAHRDLDMTKLPNVVTTPDLFSVFEAIQEAMSEDCGDDDVEVLRKVFDSVLQGGEAIGFDLSEERSWVQRLTFLSSEASA